MSWALVGIGFLIGSLPTGYLVATRVAGVDPRTSGSGNPGATNVLRIAGRGPALFVLTVDVAKGVAAAALGMYGPGGGVDLAAWTGLAAVLGHAWSPWIGFRGGKGVATALGAALVLAPGAAAVAAGSFAAIVAATRRVSAGSVAGAWVFAVVTRWLPGPPDWYPLTVAVLLTWWHRDNLRRLARGAEPPWTGDDTRDREENGG